VIPRPSADYFVVGQRQKVMLIKGIYFFLNLDYFCLDLENESKPTKKQIFFLCQISYFAVFTEYSVAEYLAGHYSAECSADRIVGRSPFPGFLTPILSSLIPA
jgi:hypothetical protein